MQNSKGDGIKAEGGTGVTYDSVHVLWTTMPNTMHGPYGVYPVSATNVLIQNCIVEGASDAGSELRFME